MVLKLSLNSLQTRSKSTDKSRVLFGDTVMAECSQSSIHHYETIHLESRIETVVGSTAKADELKQNLNTLSHSYFAGHGKVPLFLQIWDVPSTFHHRYSSSSCRNPS